MDFNAGMLEVNKHLSQQTQVRKEGCKTEKCVRQSFQGTTARIKTIGEEGWQAACSQYDDHHHHPHPHHFIRLAQWERQDLSAS